MEIGAEHLRQCEDAVPVGECSKDAGDEEFCAGLDGFLVAGRAEPAGFAGEGEVSGQKEALASEGFCWPLWGCF